MIDKKTKFIISFISTFSALFILSFIISKPVYSSFIACTQTTAVCLDNTFLFNVDGELQGKPRARIISEQIQKIADDRTIKINDLSVRETTEGYIITENKSTTSSNEEIFIPLQVESGIDISQTKYLYHQTIKNAVIDYRNQRINSNLSKLINIIIICIVIGFLLFFIFKFPDILERFSKLSNNMVIAGLDLKDLFKDDRSINLYRYLTMKN